MAPIYYVNCVFAWITVLLALAGYFYTFNRREERWAFWIVFALGWLMFAISHTLALLHVSTASTGPTVIRIIGYSLVAISLVVLMLKVGSKSGIGRGTRG